MSQAIMAHSNPVPVFYSDDYVAAAHAFDTTRKAGWVADSLKASPIPGLVLRAPAPLTEAQLAVVHDPAYVQAVRTGGPRPLAQSQGFEWDPALWTAVCASNGGAVAAARAALERGVAGSLSSGLHHARRERGAGFCTFNGLALAARAALQAGAQRVLVLDLDAHCGGGTNGLLRDLEGVWQTDLSVSGFDRYQPQERSTLDLIDRAASYLPRLEQRLREHDSAGRRFDLCLYNAGMDPFEGSSIDGLQGMTAEILAARERRVFDWCSGRGTAVAFVLAGGYAHSESEQGTLVDLHRLTLGEAVRVGASRPA